MSNDKPEPVVSRVSREFDDLNRLRKRRPLTFYLVSIVFLSWAAWYGWSQFGLVSRLKEQLRDSQGRVLLLETQLGPFRTLALDRFPGAKEADAIAKLATQVGDIQRRFEEVSSRIHSFSVRTSVRYRAKWIKDKMPDVSHLLVRGGGISGRVSFRLVSGQHEQVSFSQSVGTSLQKLDGGVIVQEDTLIASPGDTIFTRKISELSGCEELQLFLWDVSASSVEDAKVTVESVSFEILIDGIPQRRTKLVSEPTLVEIAKDDPGSAGILWKGNALLEKL